MKKLEHELQAIITDLKYQPADKGYLAIIVVNTQNLITKAIDFLTKQIPKLKVIQLQSIQDLKRAFDTTENKLILITDLKKIDEEWIKYFNQKRDKISLLSKQFILIVSPATFKTMERYAGDLLSFAIKIKKIISKAPQIEKSRLQQRLQEISSKITKLKQKIDSTSSKRRKLLYYYNLIKLLLEIRNITEAYKYIKEGIKLASELKNVQYLGYFHSYLGVYYHLKQEFNKAISAYENAIKYYNEINDPEQINQDKINIAQLYLTKNELTKAEQYLKDVIENSSILEKMLIAKAHSLLGGIYRKKANFTEAKKHLKTAYLYFLQLNIPAEKAYVRIKYGNICRDLCEFQLALKNYEKALNLAKNKISKIFSATLYNNIALIHKYFGEIDLSLTYFKNAQEFAWDSKDYGNFLEATLNIAHIFVFKNNFKKTDEYIDLTYKVKYINPVNQTIKQYILAQKLLYLNYPKDAIKQLDKTPLATLEYPFLRLKTLILKAKIYLILRKYKDAQHILNDIVLKEAKQKNLKCIEQEAKITNCKLQLLTKNSLSTQQLLTLTQTIEYLKKIDNKILLFDALYTELLANLHKKDSQYKFIKLYEQINNYGFLIMKKYLDEIKTILTSSTPSQIKFDQISIFV